MTFLIILAAISIAIPIFGSLFLCVPKWYREVIRPRLPRTPQWIDNMPDPDETAWYLFPLRLLIVLIALPVFSVVMIGTKYWLAVMSLIERKCPYTPVETAEDYDSQQQLAARFQNTPADGFAGLWKFLLGRD